MSHGGVRQLDLRPFAFPRVRDIFRPYSLPTIKERGLPIRRGRGRKRDHHIGHERTSTDTFKSVVIAHND